jgi:hypothetical protein
MVLLKTGALFGIFSALLATSVIIALVYVKIAEQLIFQWFNPALIYGLFLGGAAGTIYGISVKGRSVVYFIVGLVIGAVTSVSNYVPTEITNTSAFIVWTLSPSVGFSMLYGKLAIYPTEGIIQSVFLWSALGLFGKLFRNRIL